jgi:glycosyltransferase involved in cell wall biosynthesis
MPYHAHGVTKPRVLFLTPRFPFPVDRGDRLAAYHVLRVFARRFDVTLASFSVSPEQDAEGAAIFREWGIEILAAPLPAAPRLARLAGALLRNEPLQIAYYADPGLHDRLRALAHTAAPFDAVVCHLIRMAPFAGDVPARRRVLYLCDSIALGLERRLSHAPFIERPSVWTESRRVRAFESTVMRDFDEGWLVSEPDLESFPGERSKLRIVRHGVEEGLGEGSIPAQTEAVVGFLGHLGVPHNVDAAVVLVEQVLPRLRARGIDATVRLHGASPAPRVRRLLGLPGVEWAGFSPDLGAALRSMRVFCAPMRFGSGVQNKLLEALAAGVPVVTSPDAARAVGEEAERWIRVAEDADGYAAAITELWSPEARRRLDLESARRWVESRFRWENYADRLEQLLEGEGMTRSSAGAAP